MQHTARGHQEPFGVQFSVFLANRVGQLKELLDLFLTEKLQMLGLSVVDSTDWAVIRLVFAEPDKAREMLTAHGVPFTESPVLLVAMIDADSMAEVCGCLLRAETNVHFAYPLTFQHDGHGVMVFHVDEYWLAAETLTRNGFRVLDHEDIQGPRP